MIKIAYDNKFSITELKYNPIVILLIYNGNFAITQALYIMFKLDFHIYTCFIGKLILIVTRQVCRFLNMNTRRACIIYCIQISDENTSLYLRFY